MAIDTRDRRASVLGLNSSAPRLEQNPSGLIDQAGRQIAGLVYSGILAAVIVTAPPPTVGVPLPPIAPAVPIVAVPPPGISLPLLPPPIVPVPPSGGVPGREARWGPTGRLLVGNARVELVALAVTIRARTTHAVLPEPRDFRELRRDFRELRELRDLRGQATVPLPELTANAHGTVSRRVTGRGRLQPGRLTAREREERLALELLGWTETQG